MSLLVSKPRTKEEVKQTLAEYQRYQTLMRQARARTRAPMPPVIGAYPKFIHHERIERKFCEPKEVRVVEKAVSPEGDVYVKLQCPSGGATRTRRFSKEEAACYYDTVALEKAVGEKEPVPCEKVKAALHCADSLTPTLTEQFTGKDVSRQQADECMRRMLAKEEVSAEHTWMQYRVSPMQTKKPPRLTPEQEHDVRLGQYFAGEPIHTVTPETREEWEIEFAEKERELKKT